MNCAAICPFSTSTLLKTARRSYLSNKQRWKIKYSWEDVTYDKNAIRREHTLHNRQIPLFWPEITNIRFNLSSEIINVTLIITQFGESLRCVRIVANISLIASVRRTYQRGSHCMDFRGIWYWGLL